MGIDNIRNEKNRVRLEKQTVERKREEKKLARENHGREVYKRYHSALKIYESDFWDLFELFTSLVRGKIFKGRGFFLNQVERDTDGPKLSGYINTNGCGTIDFFLSITEKNGSPFLVFRGFSGGSSHYCSQDHFTSYLSHDADIPLPGNADKAAVRDWMDNQFEISYGKCDKFILPRPWE